MKTVVLNGRSVKLYDDISELPISRFQKYCKYSLYDAGIGGDIQSFDTHAQRIAAYIHTDPDKAIIELENMRMNVSMILNEINPSNMAFACFVSSVDGKPYNDLSDEGIKALLSLFVNEKQSKLDRIFNSVKKKIKADMETYFPQNVNNAREVEINIILRERTVAELNRIIAVCDEYISGERKGTRMQMEAAVLALNARLAMKDAPQIFIGNTAVDIRFDKDFETTCMHVTKFMEGVDARQISVLAFYQVVEEMKETAKKAKKRRK